MRNMIQVLGVTLTLSLSAAVVATPVGASEADSEIDGVDEIEAVVDDLLVELPELGAELAESAAEMWALTEPHGTRVALSMNTGAGVALALPTDSDDAIEMSKSGGRVVMIELPGHSEKAVVTEDGAVIYEDVADDTDLIVRPQVDGGVRIITVIDGPEAPERFEFEVEIEDDQEMVVGADGSVAILQDDREVVAWIPAAWAYDADGVPVDAGYSVEGSTLNLHVAHRATNNYPVVADPKFTWGWVSGTVYFDKNETRVVAGGMAVTATGLASLPTGVTQLLASQFFALWLWAYAAVYRGICLKIRWGLTWGWSGMIPGVSPGHYRGGNCR